VWPKVAVQLVDEMGATVGATVGRFAQHTKLVATRGSADRLANKFIASVEMRRENPACELMIVSKSLEDDDVIYLTEVWSSESEWEEARSSPVIAEWAADMPSLVAQAPQSVRLDPVGSKGLS
jgi:quinol monooxygenase YgiN